MPRKDTKRVLRTNILHRGIVSVLQLPYTMGYHKDRTTAVLIADIATAGQRPIQMQAASLTPDSPDEMAFGQLRAPISTIKSNSYAGSSSRILTDPTGERRN